MIHSSPAPRRSFGLWMALIPVALVGCGGGTSTQAQPQPSQAHYSVTVATGIDPTMVSPLIAQKQGFYTANGITGNVVQAESGAAALNQLLSGNADAALTVEIPGIRAAAQGAKVRILARLDDSPDYVGIVAKNNIRTAKDLIGKKVGVVQNASADYFFAKYMTLNNLSASQVQIEWLQPPEMIASLQRGFVDAFVAWEPWLNKATAALGDVHVLQIATGKALYSNPVFLYVTPQVATNRDLAERLLKSLVSADQYIGKHPAETQAAMAEAYKITPDLAKALYGKIHFKVTLTKAIISDYQSIGDWMLQAKMVSTLPDWTSLFVPGPLKTVSPSSTDLS